MGTVRKHRISERSILSLLMLLFEVAIGGGGFIPARILRTYIQIPILAVALRLYNSSGVCIPRGNCLHFFFHQDQAMSEPEIVQWLDEKNLQVLKGKRVLIVDEVDDTRKTLEYVYIQIFPHTKGSIFQFVSDIV
jgi:hypoxanthine phosphoribosyltransferase